MTWRAWVRGAAVASLVLAAPWTAWGQLPGLPSGKDGKLQLPAELTAELNSLREALQASEQRGDQLQGRLAALSARQDELLSTVDGLKGAKLALEERNGSLLSQVEALQAALASSKLDNKGLLSQIGAMQAALADNQRDMGKLNSELTNLRQTLSQRVDDAAALSGQVTALLAEAADKDARIASLSGELSGMKEADAARVLKLSELTKALAASNAEVERLRLAVARSEREGQGVLDDMKSALGEAEAAVRMHVERAQESAADAAAALSRAAGLEDQIATLKGRVEQATNALMLARDDVQKRAMELLDLQTRLSGMAAEAQRQRERADSLAARVSRVETEAAALRDDSRGLNVQRVVLAIILVASLIGNIVLWRRRSTDG